jgi:hypothetical protein
VPSLYQPVEPRYFVISDKSAKSRVQLGTALRDEHFSSFIIAQDWRRLG